CHPDGSDTACADSSTVLQLTRSRYEGQIASELDLTRAQNQLAEAKAQLDEVQGQRNLTEHAMGELVGVAASNFTLLPPNR
ncbi:TolC family protein, partial [Klebsiella pneumoniae]|uniref:TolC family protein n=1 Tax=Klebsiella pneumoniae TaxID=573 RepID=UPI002731A443